LLWALGAGACVSEPAPPQTPLEYSINAKRDYEAALEAFFDHDWEDCISQMTTVKKNYAYSRYARLAQLRIADANYHQEKFAEAISAYRSFVHDYPNDPEVPYARYRVTQALFEQCSEAAFLPPLEERDLVTVHEAYKAIQDYLSDYPQSPHRRNVEYMLEYTGGLLARHELYVARYYLKQDVYAPAVERVKYALEHYPDSGLEAEALVLLGQVYLEMKRPDEARAQFLRVLEHYPASPFQIPARNYLAWIEHRQGHKP
jgi:outer membrane protein assembly factor BamD